MYLSSWLVLVATLLGGVALANAAEPTRVSLLLGDSATKRALEVARDVVGSTPELRGVSVKVYSTTHVREQDMEFLKRSDLVIMLIMGRTLINSIHDEVAYVVRRGGKVYAVGASYNEDDRKLGILANPEIKHYFEAGGATNIRNGLLYALSTLGYKTAYEAPQPVPDVALYEAQSKQLYTDFEAYRQHYGHFREGRPWVGVVFYQSNVQTDNMQHIDAVIAALEQRGFNALPAYGFPSEKPIERFFFDENGRGRVDAAVAAAVKIGVNPDTMIPLLSRLNAPVINAISLNTLSRAEWEASPVGMDIMERSWQLAMPEMAGLIQPTVFAAKERVKDPDAGMEYLQEQPIPERVEMLANRVERWVALRRKPNRDKRVLLQYFNFPPGKDAIGASFLNVVPESLWQVMKRMEQEGYNLAGMPADKAKLQEDVVQYGSNIPTWETKEVEALARSGQAVLLPIETYKKWFAELPKASRDFVIKSWGPPEANTIMAHVDGKGKRYFVLPVRRYGNILLAPQPSRGWTENPEQLYHDVSTSPSHQYLAFYFWLRKEFKADAMLQFGTHGTHEWLSGKEAGMSINDPPEYLIQDLPNLYAFIMDDPGEGIQAQRRGMAVMIDHLTPPFDKASLNPELRELLAGINEYHAALQKSPQLAEAKLAGVIELATRVGILKDLDLTPEQLKNPTPKVVEQLDEYLEEISDKPTPFGLHTLGVAPEEKFVQSTAEAIVSLESSLNDQQRKDRIEQLKGLIRLSAKQELDAVVAGLSGRYIPAGAGGDPLRNPEALPTGRNFYSFDPRRIPADSTYKLGMKLANELIKGYKAQHGEYPTKLTFTLWGVETMRHEGVQESQIMYLMGVRPVWDERGVVRDIQPIAREELGRPRIDVTIIPSGMHRDVFSNVLELLDKAVSVAQSQEETDNAVRNHTLKTQAMLEGKGIKRELAARMAGVRMFSVPPGAYGTNLSGATERSDTWKNEKEVADIYFMRMSHMYGQGFWGDTGQESGQKDVGQELLKNALSGTKMTVHSRSSNVYGLLTGDDPFQSFGGVTMAVRAVDGTSPEVAISNLENVADVKQESLDKYLGREMRTRYLNPEWIKAAQKEGYAGAKMMNETVQNLWGWQVTVPEAVDAAKWNEIFETYVHDRYDLNMEQFFRSSNNLWAYQSLMARMLEAVRKGYWKPSREVVNELSQRVGTLVQELQEECSEKGCADPILNELVRAELVAVPAMSASPPPVVKPASSAVQPRPQATPSPESATEQVKQVTGRVMEEIQKRAPQPQMMDPSARLWGFLLASLLLAWGFYRARANAPSATNGGRSLWRWGMTRR